MKKGLLFIAIAFMASCTKDDETSTDLKDNKGTVRFTNTSTNPYSTYIDGATQGTVTGKNFIEVKATAGTHKLKAVQNSGYVVYPTVVEVTAVIAAGKEKEFIFP